MKTQFKEDKTYPCHSYCILTLCYDYRADNKERIWGEKGRTDPAYEIMDGRTTERSPEVKIFLLNYI